MGQHLFTCYHRTRFFLELPLAFPAGAFSPSPGSCNVWLVSCPPNDNITLAMRSYGFLKFLPLSQFPLVFHPFLPFLRPLYLLPTPRRYTRSGRHIDKLVFSFVANNPPRNSIFSPPQPFVTPSPDNPANQSSGGELRYNPPPIYVFSLFLCSGLYKFLSCSSSFLLLSNSSE